MAYRLTAELRAEIIEWSSFEIVNGLELPTRIEEAAIQEAILLVMDGNASINNLAAEMLEAMARVKQLSQLADDESTSLAATTSLAPSLSGEQLQKSVEWLAKGSELVDRFKLRHIHIAQTSLAGDLQVLKADVQALRPDGITNQYLGQLLRLAQIHYNSIYIHPRILAYNTEQLKVNAQAWLSDEDGQAADIFGKFVQAQARGRLVKLGLFVTPSSTWVGSEATDKDGNPINIYKDWWNFHAWVAAIISPEQGQGKRVLIYDSDMAQNDVPTRQHGFMSSQKQLLQHLQRNGTPAREVWATVDMRQPDGERDCLRNAFVWLLYAASYGNKGWQGEQDERAMHMKVVPK